MKWGGDECGNSSNTYRVVLSQVKIRCHWVNAWLWSPHQGTKQTVQKMPMPPTRFPLILSCSMVIIRK